MEELGSSGNQKPNERIDPLLEEAETKRLQKKTWWQRLINPVNAPPEPQKLPEGTPLPDILTKMLVDVGCTVNKEGMEVLADYFISTLMQSVEDHEAHLRTQKREIQNERDRYRPQQ